MSDIQITCDSACDIPRSLLSRYGIQEISMGVQVGKTCLRDKVTVHGKELCQYFSKYGIIPKIFSPSPREYKDCFRSYTDQGQKVLHISLSGSLGDSYENACTAAEGLPGVAVIDSRSISAGAGQLALLAADLINADYRLEELANALNEMKEHLDVSCILQSSQYLRKKDLPACLSAFRENLLHLKPEVHLEKGILRRGKPFHGDLESSILSYVRSCLSGRKNIQTDRIFVTYCGVPDTVITKVKVLLKELQPFEQILEVPAESAVSCCCGPGSLGLSFMTT